MWMYGRTLTYVCMYVLYRCVYIYTFLGHCFFYIENAFKILRTTRFGSGSWLDWLPIQKRKVHGGMVIQRRLIPVILQSIHSEFETPSWRDGNLKASDFYDASKYPSECLKLRVSNAQLPFPNLWIIDEVFIVAKAQKILANDIILLSFGIPICICVTHMSNVSSTTPYL